MLINLLDLGFQNSSLSWIYIPGPFGKNPLLGLPKRVPVPEIGVRYAFKQWKGLS